MNKFAALALLTICFGLAGCASAPKNDIILNAGAPLPPPSKIPEKIHDLSAAEITQVVVGRTFQYTRKGASGFVVYNADGTMRVQDDLKGASIGKWTVNGNQYCETYGPTQPMECGAFKTTGNAYFAANSRIEDMRI